LPVLAVMPKDLLSQVSKSIIYLYLFLWFYTEEVKVIKRNE